MFNSIFFYFSHVQRDSVQYIKNNKHLYYKGGLHIDITLRNEINVMEYFKPGE